MGIFKPSGQVYGERIAALEEIESQAMHWMMGDNWLLRYIGSHAADFAHEQKKVAINRTFERMSRR